MKTIYFTTLLTFFLNLLFAQESFTMEYGCYKVFTPTGGKQSNGANNGSWSRTADIEIKVDFSVGTNKNIVVYTYGDMKVYRRIKDPIVSETPGGMKFQLITTTNGGKTYFFQYLENYNLRLLTNEDDRMIEYGCVKDFDKSEGVTESKYSVKTQRAYFYKTPQLNSKKAAYLIYGDVVFALQETNDFILVNYTNSKGIKSSGWILKSSLSPY